MIQESDDLEQMAGLGNSGQKRWFSAYLPQRESEQRATRSVFIPKIWSCVKGLATGCVYSDFSLLQCRAIDLLGENSLAPYVTHPMLNIATMRLIIASGLGFPVWWDLGKTRKLVFQREAFTWQSLQDACGCRARLVLTTTGILLAGGTVLILLFEYHNPDTLGKLSFGQKLMAAAFQSVTTRTAGFFTLWTRER